MANARQCDRCGKFYMYNAQTPTNIECKTYSGLDSFIYLEGEYNRVDLCKNCLNSLKGWWTLNNGENSEEDK